MRQNKNITIAFDLSEKGDKEALEYLATIATNVNRSISQISKTLLELGIIIFDNAVKEQKKNENNSSMYRGQ